MFDDRSDVWPEEYQSRLLLAEPYHFLTNNLEKLRSLARGHAVEMTDYDQHLAMIVPVLKGVHENFFGFGTQGYDLPRAIILIQNQVLKGVRLAVDTPEPWLHKYLHWAKAAGAEVVDEVDEHVTHLVTKSAYSERTQRAFRNGLVLVVHPMWLQACCAAWRRADEEHFFIEAFHHLSPDFWERLTYLYPAGYWSLLRDRLATQQKRKRREGGEKRARTQGAPVPEPSLGPLGSSRPSS